MMFSSYICSSSLKNASSNSSSSRDRLAIWRIPLSSNEKSSPPIVWSSIKNFWDICGHRRSWEYSLVWFVRVY